MVDPPSYSFTIACYTMGISVLVIFGIMALYLSTRKQSNSTEAFITARQSQPLLRVAWSFYAVYSFQTDPTDIRNTQQASIGAWAIFVPAAYTAFGGYVSIITYAVATGLPLLLIAEFGAVILKRIPDVMSLNDYALKMYGKPVQLFVVALSLVNMAVALISEYTAIGDLFEHYVGGERMGIIIVVGVITALYTASGGLMVSILTDRAQAIMSLVLILVASIYLATEFRLPIKDPLPSNLGVNYAGLSSVFSLPISLLSSAIYSEAFWQRVWAAEDPSSLRWGAVAGFGLTTIVIAFFAFVGFLGLAVGLPALDDHNNLAFFVPFSDAATEGGHGPSTMGAMVIRVFLVILAMTMNESAVDSLQNAIVATISSTFLVNKPVYWSRILVFLVNAPIVIVALQGYALLDLFLAMNILTTTSTFPLLSALCLPEVSGTTVFLSSFISLFCTCLLGVLVQGGNVSEGLRWTFTSRLNFYDYRIFLVAALTSVTATYLSWLFLDRRGRGLSAVHDTSLQPLLCCISPRRRHHSSHSSRHSSSRRNSRSSSNGGAAAPSCSSSEQELPPSPTKIGKLVRVTTYDSIDSRFSADDETPMIVTEHDDLHHNIEV